MRQLHDLSALAQHYTGLFGSRGLFLLADRLARRALPSAAYLPIRRFLWPVKGKGGRTEDESSQFGIRNSQSAIRNPQSEIRDWFASRFPNGVEQKIAAADQICNHVFDFLGTGPTHWGDSIDWHQDTKSGYHWLVKFYTDYRSDELMPGNGVDVKIPWELSRLHHFVTLAQAWWLTGEGRYADEFFAQWESWLAANPWPYGINWTCAMEVSIRAVNLLWAQALLADAPGWTPGRCVNFEQSLRQHGLFIEHNLEVGARDGHVVTANHYLANVCGLACLSLFCLELPDADRWRRVGLRALEQEMQRQVLPDGLFFESSTSYHRLAVELFLIPALLARRCGHEIAGAYWQRLEQMMEVILYITRPDGCVPLIGDNDDGRLLILSHYPDWPRHDHRYLLALGAVLFQRGDLKAASFPSPRVGRGPGGEDYPEEVFWLLGREGVDQFDALAPDPTPVGSRAFPHGGLYVIRSQDNRDYALVRTWTNSPSSIPTAHAHNDALSLEMWLDGQPVFVDTGTCCYTPNLEVRNWFCSTAAHNTVMVDGQEINRIPPDEPFRLERDAHVRVLEWHLSDDEVRLLVEHDSYGRLSSPVRHRRCVHYDAVSRVWTVTDELAGAGTHEAIWRWHGDADAAMHVEYMDADIGHIQLVTATAQIFIAIESPVLDWSQGLERSSYAPGYGRCKPASCFWVAVQFEERCSISWSVRCQLASTDPVPRPVHQRSKVEVVTA